LLEDRVVPADLFHTNYIVAGGPYGPNFPYQPNWAPNGGNPPYSPQDLQIGYTVNNVVFPGGVVGTGAGQTIAIVDAFDDPNLISSTSANWANSDLHLFDQQFGIPDPPSFLKVDQNGGTNYPATNAGWSVEESLDVEWAHSIAPMANIMLVEASGANANLFTAVQHASTNFGGNFPNVSVISLSWGGGESAGETGTDAIFKANNVTFLAATGDSGGPGGYPAYSPNVIAVGGTNLNLNSSSQWVSETGWSGSSGGASQVESEPAYQVGVQNTGQRTIPDVASDASPATGVWVLDNFSGGWQNVGGTSLACPTWAGHIAIINQGRSLADLKPLTGYNQTLPDLYNFYNVKPGDFHDITSGYNYYYSCVQGYDLVTGMGTPIMQLLAPDFAEFTDAAPKVITSSGNATYQGGQPPQVIDANIAVTDVDSGHLQGATIQITNNYLSSEDVLGFTAVGNINGSWNSATGTLTLTGKDTVANYQAALRSVTYQDTAAIPTTNIRTVTFTAFDGLLTGSATRGVNVMKSPINITPATLPSGTVFTAYSPVQLSASGGTPSYTFSITSGSLPPGINMSGGGLFTGTPAITGTFGFDITAKDSKGNTGTQVYSIVVNPPTITVSPNSPLTTGQVAANYDVFFSAAGGTAPYSFALTAGTMPAGLSLNALTGELNGVPTAGGPFNFTITATDSSGGTGPYTGSNTYSLTINPPLISLSPTTLPDATVAVNYSQNLTASGGTGPYGSFTVVGGILPAGLTLSSSGILGGTATAGGTFNFTIKAFDSSTGTGPYFGTQAYTLQVDPPTITVSPGSLPNAQVGAVYTPQTFSASGGTAPYQNWGILTGALPPGMTLNANTGVLSGTPTAGGSFSFTVQAYDSTTGAGPYAGTQSLSLTVDAPTLSITPSGLPAGQVGVGYNQTLALVGGTAPATFTVLTGSLPPGLTLSSAGLLSGTPTGGGSFSFSVRATDSSTGTGPYKLDANYTVLVLPPSINLSPANLPNAVVGASYNQTLIAAGGTAPYKNFTISVGGLPPGLALSNTGTLSGTATASGTFSFAVQVTDSSVGTGPYTQTQDFTLTVQAPNITFSPSSLPNAQVGVGYNQPVTASGGTAPYSNYRINGGTLPAGLSMSPTTGTISGTPTAGGSFTFNVLATDSTTGGGPYTGVTTYTLVVSPPSIAIVPSPLPNAQVGVNYIQTLSASGGTAPYNNYQLVGGALPAGLIMVGPVISGTPTAGGSFSITVQTTDSSTGTGPYTQTSTLTLNVQVPNLVMSPASPLPNAKVGNAYTVAVNVTGGTAPYHNFQVTSGSLPAGVSMSSTGQFSGTPTAGGTFTFTVQALDSSTGTGPYLASTNYTLVVDKPSISFTPANLSAATVAQSYAQTLTAGGGTAPYSNYLVTSGSLPTGMSVSTTGVLSGTPTAGGTYTFTLQVQDSSTGTGPYTGSQSYTLIVNQPNILVSPASLPSGQIGVAYGQRFIASGGTAPYVSYTITSGVLPAGLTLASNGVLTGIPAAGGTFHITVTATDSSGGTGPYTGNTAYTLVITPPTFTFGPPSLPNAAVGASYSQSLTVSGATAPYTSFAVIGGTLPAGLALLTSGQLTGTPTGGGTFTFTVQAYDSSTGAGPYVGSSTYTLAVNVPTITVSPGNMPAGKIGVAFSQTLSAAGGTAPYGSYFVTSGVLPAGLTLSPGGVLTGTPTAGGLFPFSIRALDSSTGTGPYSGTTSYLMTVNDPSITLGPGSLADAAIGTRYNTTLTAVGGTAPYRNFTIVGGALPAGLSLAPQGIISGTPTAGGVFTFTVRAQDSSTGAGPYSASTSYTLTVDAPAITVNPSSLPLATVGKNFSVALTGYGGTSPYSNFQLAGGNLAPGITLSATGLLSGVPSATGTFTFAIQTQDSSTGTGPFTGSTSYSLTVNPPTITIGPPSLLAANVAAAYSQTLVASGGAAPYGNFIITSGRLPAGLSLASDGTISGTPTAGGNFTFTVQGQDSSGGTGPYSGSATYTLIVNAPTISVNPASVPDGRVGSSYSVSLSASGGTSPYGHFALANGTLLPVGMTLSQGGVISGTPTAGGTFTFTVQARDSSTGSGPYTGNTTYTMTIDAPTITVSPATVLGGTVASSYSQSLSANGGTGPYTFGLVDGSLPAGITLTPGGTISGTPTSGGTFTFRVGATDSSTGTGAPYTQIASYTLTIGGPTITLSPPSLPGAAVAAAYSQALSASGGTAPYGSFAITSGTLPAGLNLSSTGVISGTPTAGGTFNFVVQAKDSTTGTGPYAGSQAYSLTVAAPTVTVGPGSLPGGEVYFSYSQVFNATGGTSPYTFAVTGGSLPAGLTLTSNGTLSGAPTVSGTFNFTVQATDASTGAGPYSAGQAYSLVVTVPTVTISPSTLADGQVGVAMSQSISADGANAPYRFSLSAGSLPAGLTMSSAGVLSGTPTAGGVFHFTVKASDSSPVPFTATQAYTLNVAAPTFTFSALPDAQVAARYNQAISLIGGTAPYKLFTIVSGQLPTGLVLTSAGVLTGSPTAGGTFTFTVRATDSSTGTGPYKPTQSYTLNVTAPNIVLSAPSLPPGQVGVAFNAPVQASGGIGPYHYSVDSGSLPPGVILNASTGSFTGKPTAGGTYDFVLKVTDSSRGAGPYFITESLELYVAQVTTVLFVDPGPTGGIGSQVAPFQVQVLDQNGQGMNGLVTLKVVLANTNVHPSFTAGSIIRVMAVNGVATFSRVGVNTTSLHLPKGQHQYQIIAAVGTVSAMSDPFSLGTGNRLN
jgi:hypothetical protein